jgi:hypothetical protein
VSVQKTLAGFIAKYDAPVRATAIAALAKMHARWPGAMQLVYDGYDGLVIDFSPTERTADTIFSIVLYPRWVTLSFPQGTALPDPERLLKGSGGRVRHVVLEDAGVLDTPAVRSLITAALENAVTPLVRKSGGKVILKRVQVKQRARRPAGHVPKTR